MLKFKLITYRPEAEYKGSHFFILNKGLNSGKPLNNPCPNCFVCIANSEDEKDELFWLVFGLWQGKVFYQNLLGSVIRYIRKDDLRDNISHGIFKFEQNIEKARKNISAIVKIEENRLNILKQNKLMNELKQALILEILK